MVAGHLRVIKGTYHIILSFKDEDGVKRNPSFSTLLVVKGNKRIADTMLTFVKTEYVIKNNKKEIKTENARIKKLIMKKFHNKDTVVENAITEKRNVSSDMLFVDYLEYWLRIYKNKVRKSTYASYKSIIEKRVIPYFQELNVVMSDLSPLHIQEYYDYCIDIEKISASTIKRRHANIRKALQMAVNVAEIIDRNPADKVELKKTKKYEAKIYDESNLQILFDIVLNTKMDFPVMMATFYGLRREEVIGLKWSAIDFKNKVFTINHTVTQFNLNNETIIYEEDDTKNGEKKVFPFIQPFEELLLRVKKIQSIQKELCGNAYETKYKDYICLDEVGNRIRPGYITQRFSKILKQNNLPHIRFHDLRHSCATLLYRKGVPIQYIQEWLGHADVATTSKIYTHFDFSTKIVSANAITSSLSEI